MAVRPAAAKVEELEIDSMELPAPAGWKKFVPKDDGIPKRNSVLFISPTGEEIRSRYQLTVFLRSHPGGPSPSEFDWKYGGTPRQSTRIIEKKKVVEPPEEGPKSHKRKSNLKDRKTKHRKNDRVTDEDEKDEVPESEKTAIQVVEGIIVDAEMKDAVEDSSMKEKVEPAANTILDEIEVKVADQDSSERPEEKNINQPEKLPSEDSNKDVPVIFAPEEISVTSENQETLGVEEVGEDVPVINEHEESEKEKSYASEHGEKQGAREESNEAPVLSVPEVTKDEDMAVRENRVDSKASPRDAESIKEILREKEVKDRAFLTDTHKWEQKTVSTS